MHFVGNGKSKSVPLMPMEWIRAFEPSLSMEQMLVGSSSEKLRFKWKRGAVHLAGVDWNARTKQQSVVLNWFLDDNMVKRLALLPSQHRSDGDKWDVLVREGQIAQHLRFKINFLALKGAPTSGDTWINQYIQLNY